jgi:hypothetical protein
MAGQPFLEIDKKSVISSTLGRFWRQHPFRQPEPKDTSWSHAKRPSLAGEFFPLNPGNGQVLSIFVSKRPILVLQCSAQSVESLRL